MGRVGTIGEQNVEITVSYFVGFSSDYREGPMKMMRCRKDAAEAHRKLADTYAPHIRHLATKRRSAKAS